MMMTMPTSVAVVAVADVPPPPLLLLADSIRATGGGELEDVLVRPGSFRHAVKLMTRQFVDVAFDQAAAGSHDMYLLGSFLEVVAGCDDAVAAAVVQLLYLCDLVVL